jgi:hypothetical protein
MEDYKRLCMDYYILNQKALDNSIITISVLAFPFIFYILNLNIAMADFFYILSKISLVGFSIVIIMKIYSLKIAIKGCDRSMGKSSMDRTYKDSDEADRPFNLANCFNIWVEIIFFASIFAILFVIICGVLFNI